MENRENQGGCQQQEGICPDCEAHNTGKGCAAGGSSRPKPEVRKGPISKKTVIAAMAAVVIVAAALASTALLLPNYRYRKACRLMESGQYEQAYQAFTSMPDYRDSRAMRNQTVIRWADQLEKSGEYDKAVRMLAHLSTDEQATQMKKQLCVQWARELCVANEFDLALKALEPVSGLDGIGSMATEIRYSKGQWLLRDQKNYADAYQEFTALGDYRDSERYASQAAEAWIQRTLDNPDVAQATRIWETVTLSGAQAQQLYQELYTRDLYTYDSPDRSSASYNADDFLVRRILLETLPEDFYPNRERLVTLLEELDEEEPGLFVQEHRDILEKLWDMPLVRNIVRHSLCIDEWLLGTWRTENSGCYFKFTRSDSGGYDVSYNVPWVAEPEGTAYYSIYNLTFSWVDENNHVLADVYRFNLLSPNQMEIYAFENQKTYTMTRK